MGKTPSNPKTEKSDQPKKPHGNRGKKRIPGETRPARLYRVYLEQKHRKGNSFKRAMICGPLNVLDVDQRRGFTEIERVGIGAVPVDKAAGNLCRIYAAAEMLREIVSEHGGYYEDISGHVKDSRGRDYFVVQAFVHGLDACPPKIFGRLYGKIHRKLNK